MPIVCMLLAAAFAATGPTEAIRDVMRAAAEKQRAAAAAQRQATASETGAGGFMLAPLEFAPDSAEEPEPACEPIGEVELAPLIERAAKAQDLQPKLLRAVIEQESAFRPCAVSVKGAQGLMQLMPETAREMGVEDSFDPGENVDAGAKYLKQLLGKFKGDLARALGAYNAGPAAAADAGGAPDIQETKNYVDAIMQRLAK